MSAIDPSNQGQTDAPQEQVKAGGQPDSASLSHQGQALVPQGEAGGQTGNASSPGQARPAVPNAKVEMIAHKDAPAQPRPPLDLFSLFYWLLFLLLVPTVAFWMAHKPAVQVSLPLLNHALPVYHVITAGDLSLRLVDQSKVTNDTERSIQDLIGHYTLATIPANQPISRGQIGPQPEASLITGTLAVAVPANTAMIFGGSLHAGDIVTMAVVPTSTPPSLPTMLFDKVLVLDVKSTGTQSIIVLAIPADRWLEYLARTHNATVVLARRMNG